MIRRRHVIYVEGYDPQGAEGYYRLFARSWKTVREVWSLTTTLGALQIESQDFAHWDIDAGGPNWRVATRYDFLRQEHIIRANMAEPLRRQLPRALAWTFDYLVSGALGRVLRANWRFGLVLIYFQCLVLWWLELAAVGGFLAGWAAVRWLDLPGLAGVAAGVVVTPLLVLALRPLADRLFAVQINNHWPHLCAFARGEPTCFDAPIEACARRVVAAARANEADEIVVVGHSGGGALAPAVIARALELDPEVGRRGPPLILLTPGSIAPGAALHPSALKLRAVFARLAAEPSITWIDFQARKDFLNFWEFDPIEDLGIEVGPQRCNPLIWKVRVHDMLTEELYRKIGFNFFRLHYQFIMANDRRAPYDYYMLLCGPLPVVTWAADPMTAFRAFAPDGSLASFPTATGAVAARSAPFAGKRWVG